MSMPSRLALARCMLHGSREAAGRCTGCKKHFCRECLLEIDGKLTCSKCLHVEEEKATSRFSLAKILSGANLFLGILALWLIFYFVGRTLLNISDLFHQSFIE